MTAIVTTKDARGEASAPRTKDRLYLLRRGFIYTSSSVAIQAATGFAGMVLLSVERDSFNLTLGERTYRYRAAAAKPLVARGVRARDVPLIIAGVSPNHPLYRRFRAIPDPGALPVPRVAYGCLDELLSAAHQGTLPVSAASDLFENIITTTARHLPQPGPTDARIERVLEMLRENPGRPLKGLASAVGLSYDRMSHLFTETVGLPLRSYLLWQKLHAVAALLGSGMTLTEMAVTAGFADSSHLSNTWQKTYGAPPSFFLDRERVEVHTLRTTPPPPQVAARVMQALPSGSEYRCRHCGSVLTPVRAGTA